MKYVTRVRSKRVLSHIILFLSILCTITLPVGYAALTVTPVRAAGAAWYDGLIQYSDIINCVSIIQGAPYPEKGAGAYVGFLADPDAAKPAPNETYYVHIVVAGLGNTCSGMRAYLDVGLPASTTLAIDATNKVYCSYDNVALPAAECPQSLPASSYNAGMYAIPSIDSAHSNTWPIPQGRILEIKIPVRTSTQLSNSPMQGKVWMLDGNDSPWLQLQQGIYVFSSLPSSPPAILYPSPSTTSIMSTTARSEAYLYSHGIGGTGYFDLGTDTTYSQVHEAVSIPAGGNAFLAWDNWGPPALLPDTLYHWRFIFTYADGTIYGADQTFRTLPNGVATVGSGMTGSCTEAALISALATANQVNFACGPLPATITLTSPRSITANVTINGNNLVTLLSNGATNHFNVQSSAHLFLNKIRLENGSNTATCGGSIHVLGNGQLTLTETTFHNNSTSNGLRGGAVCVDASGSAVIHASVFTSNHAGHGGGVFNSGTLTVDHSVFTGNTAATHGGALQNYGTGTLSDTGFEQNTAGTNGGAIDAGGVLSVIRGSFRTNTAGTRGGGINEYGGTLSVTESSFVSNHSNGYGGGMANDEGTVTIVASEFSGNTAVGVGGGLRSNGATIVTNSTFSGNHSDGNGGGIENSSASAIAQLFNTSLAGNSTNGQGGNIYIGANTSNHLTLKNTLVAAGSPNNCDAPVASQGYNLESANSCGLAAAGDRINTAPQIGPLQDNGGPTRTLGLLTGSPAIDTAQNSGCPATDGRGITRPFDGNADGTATCDIGAFEYTGNGAQLFLPLIIR